jgi:hypothetical protein
MQAARALDVSSEAKTSATMDVSRPTNAVPMETALRQMSLVSKMTPMALTRDFAALAIGPGRVSFADYMKLRLFDTAFYGDNDRRQVVGQRRNRGLVLLANYRLDWMGLFADKIASASYLAAYGLPVPAAQAIYCEALQSSTPTLCRNRDDLRTFLMTEENYPLFGKPTHAFQSLGSMGLKRYVSASNSVELADGSMVALDKCVADIANNYATGYLLQKLLTPHPAVKALCGDRLATVRVVTTATASGPKVFRACWKIPAGGNLADNYWRAGNLLAQIDPATGRVMRAMSGTGLALQQHTHHPDTQANLIGATVPLWDAIVSTAIEGAKLLRHMPLIGWDMASLDSGATIIEMNETPDLSLNQLADARGILDDEFSSFLQYQKAQAKVWKQANRRDALQL